MPFDATHYQFLVIGAGSAGCVVAARLAAAGCQTLLIEAGGADLGARPEQGTGLLRPEIHPDRYWPSLAEGGDPNGGMNRGAVNRYWMGRGMGGGSAVNGMLISPGDDADYNRWAAEGDCPGWDAEAMTPWLDKATAVLAPELPLPSSPLAVVGAFDAGFGQFGLEPAGSTLDGDRAGLLAPALSMRDGVRRSVADAYLEGDIPNLSIRTGTTATSLLVEDRSVVGAAFADGTRVGASTVVVAAGTVGSARLMRTANVLSTPGGWIKNHSAAVLTVPWPDRNEQGDDNGLLPTVHRVARWRSSRAETGPDLVANLMGPFPGPGQLVGVVVVMASLVRSAGHLDLDVEPPALITNRLSHHDDAARLREGVRQVSQVCHQMTRSLTSESNSCCGPGSGDLSRMSDSELDQWLLDNPGPVYHAVGSCRMGTSRSNGAITYASSGQAGRVRELDGVVVTDASLFPDLVAGGLQLPVMAVAERIAAETLLGAR